MDKVSWIRQNCIGRGSFGTVNLAVDKLDGRIFAVKSVEMNSCSSKQLEALENEISILKSLSSPYVVEYLCDDITAEEDKASLIRNLHMEYLPGGSVAELSVIDESTVQSYTWCLASALKYLHGRGIVHCDIKGKNVLVGPGCGSAKLADFGSAKELFFNRAATSGSPLWMAPEVIRGEYQGPESDVWSLGCTVIEMITGKPAWEDCGVTTLIQIACSDDLPKIPTGTSENLRDFLDKCLRRNLAERWSCNQLLQHPFLSNCSPPVTTDDFSPKCVLDRVDSNFSDEEIEYEYSDSSSVPNANFNARERITELAGSSVSGSGANWESDGWVEVRGANSSESETTGTNSEYSESERTNSEYLDTDGCPCLQENNSYCSNLNLLYTKYDYKCKINRPCAIFYMPDSTNTNIYFN